MRGLGLFVVIAAACLGQAAVPSPYELVEEVNGASGYDMAGLMRQLGLPQLFGGEAAERREWKCSGSNCEAAMLDVGGFPRRTVLKFCMFSGEFCRLTLFEKPGARGPWFVAGHLDTEHKYGVKAYVDDGLLIVEQWWGSGSGVANLGQNWYELTSQGMKLALSIPKYGHDLGVGPHALSRTWSAAVVKERLWGERQELAVLYFSGYFIGKDEKLFDDRRIATYIRANGQTPFHLDPARSEVTQAQIDKICRFTDGDSGLSMSEFLSFFKPKLLRIARIGTSSQREWLRMYLDRAPASASKSELLGALRAPGR